MSDRARKRAERTAPRAGTQPAAAPAAPPTARSRGATLRAWWPAVLVLAAGALVYANTLGHGFVWDDLITLDQRIRFWRSPLDAFIEPADVPGFPGVYRPLTFASFWVDQLLWWRNPLGFHVVSVLLHAVNGVLVYALARGIGCRTNAAIAGALLFAVHPIHTEAVAWVTARVDVLATTFTLVAVLAFLRARRAGRLGLGSAVAIGVASFAAAASKEPGAVVPALIALAATVPPRAGAAAVRGGGAVAGADGARASDAIAAVVRAWPAIAASAAGIAVYLLLRAVNRGGEGSHLGALDAATLGRLGRAFGFYVERLVFPVGLRAYLPEVPGGVAVVLCAVGGALAAAAALRAPRPRFAVLWIALTLAPSLLVTMADISVTAVAERYLYLPSVGIALAVAIALSARAPLPRVAWAAVAAVLVLLAAATVVRNRVWHDEITLWTDVTEHEHAFALPYMNLGLALADAGRWDDAEPAYRTALAARASPTTTRDTYINLGHLQLRRGRYDDALAAFAQANAIAPHATAYYGIGGAHVARARGALAAGDGGTADEEFARAEAALNAALAINPRHFNSHYVLASVLYQRRDFAGALEHYRRVVELAPDTEAGKNSADNARQLAAWLADPANRGAAAAR